MFKIAAVFLSLFLAPNSWAGEVSADVVELTAAGGVNWGKGTVFADGIGVPPERIHFIAQRHALACRAAVVDAQRNLLESTKGVRIEAKTLLRDMVVESDIVRTTVEGVIRGAQMTERVLQPDGSCQVRMRMDLSGRLAASLYQQVYPQDQSLGFSDDSSMLAWLAKQTQLLMPAAIARPVALDVDVELRKLDARVRSLEQQLRLHPEQASQVAERGAATGLIIDARGLGFKPSMAPRIHGPKKVLYPDRQQMKASRANGQMIALFMRSLLVAQRHPRVGERPLLLKAVKSFGRNHVDVQLNTDAAKQLANFLANDTLHGANVIIVMD